MSTDYTLYVDGGVGSPKFLLRNRDDTATLTTITMSISATTQQGSVDTRPNRPQSGWVKETYNAGITPDGRIVEKCRGFRYYETLVFDIVSKDDLAEIKAIIGHKYKIKYYPHSDNTTRWLYVLVDGNYGYLNQNITLPYHNASLTIKSLVTVDKIPHDFNELHIMYQPDWAAGFSATEKALAARIMNYTDWAAGSFSTVEKGYSKSITQGMGDAQAQGYISHK
jgi:hypothetical protein